MSDINSFKQTIHALIVKFEKREKKRKGQRKGTEKRPEKRGQIYFTREKRREKGTPIKRPLSREKTIPKQGKEFFLF
ncbi:MAG: hypothetical protein A3G39_02895 [Deltaproteobacteria bacterium RIFCSPLOWO2_12_FULL_43_16]|nr:MAG: hypothetical protein A2Z89_01445 [Deltaproteobacteria bacterium GWA2_43_19]OGQ11938.1 MAG: hypothetical protein A3D30_08680 [Deltaproteobacteria bacterium RIFCSPHIGHO2_02_FULL_43_33]OGQ61432.1 MAG: hypothetical protein A3G39_02895 [Deltaproteobacteria bacterium RIFCSPLOWO2_12_FULL_43_16]HBR18445.1 hypothetical protein [Deltaproteobacteria bacterium]